MKSKPEAVSLIEGEDWLPWATARGAKAIHAIRFEDGSIFDTVNGWRAPTMCDLLAEATLPKGF